MIFIVRLFSHTFVCSFFNSYWSSSSISDFSLKFYHNIMLGTATDDSSIISIIFSIILILRLPFFLRNIMNTHTFIKHSWMDCLRKVKISTLFFKYSYQQEHNEASYFEIIEFFLDRRLKYLLLNVCLLEIFP